LPHDIVVSAFVVTNALGDIGADGVSNLPNPDDDLTSLLATMHRRDATDADLSDATPATSHAVIATNVALENAALTRIARTGSQGLVRGMSPASLMGDGDVVFALSSHDGERLELPDVEAATLIDVIGIGAAEAVRRAVLASVEPPAR
jgi:L-aminopeptidase/D-esterase-like protein